MIYIKSEGEWLANKVVQGFFASPIESLVEVSIADIVRQLSPNNSHIIVLIVVLRT